MVRRSRFHGGLLRLDAPDIVSQTYVGPAPVNYVTRRPSIAGSTTDANLAVPLTDAEFLGGLYHAYCLTAPSSTTQPQVMVRDVDYQAERRLGQIANLNKDRLGTPEHGSLDRLPRGLLERLDLIEAFAGRVARGHSRRVRRQRAKAAEPRRRSL